MSIDRAPIRSYQRIFKPERRIYQVEGHRLPVPGGVPLRWVAYAIGALLAILALSGHSLALAAALATAAGSYGLLVGGASAALLAGAAVLSAAQLAGWLLPALDWPLRLVVAPALLATAATQPTPDARATHRYVLSWLGLQLGPTRRSLGRALDAPPRQRAQVWTALDWHCSELRHALVHGPAVVRLIEPRLVVRGGRDGRRLSMRPVRTRRSSRVILTNRVELIDGETLELRR
jgi:hypothetical protein